MNITADTASEFASYLSSRTPSAPVAPRPAFDRALSAYTFWTDATVRPGAIVEDAAANLGHLVATAFAA